jgi:L-cystine transport system permease protein
MFSFNFFFEVLFESARQLPVSFLITVISISIGIVIGTIAAIAQFYQISGLGKLLRLCMTVIRSIPVVLQLLLIYFLVLNLFDTFAIAAGSSLRAKDVPLVSIVLIAFSLNASAYFSEAIRSALLSVESGQFEAAYAIGMTPPMAFVRIILPQLLPVFIPALCNNFIGTFKATSLAYIVTVTDILNTAIAAANLNYRYMEAYTAAALVYWFFCLLAENFFAALEKRVQNAIGGTLS